MAPGEAERARPATWQDLGVRTLSAIVLIPAVLLDVWLGGAWYELFVLSLCVLIAREWTSLAAPGDEVQFALHVVAAIGAGVLARDPGTAALLLAVLWVVSAVVAPKPRKPWAIFGIPYVGAASLAMMVFGNAGANGAKAIIWVMVVIWTADTMAYFAGRLIGGPKLAPVLSPKKTWAGLAGAIIGAGVAGLIAGAFIGVGSLPALGFLGGLLGLIGQAGDLFKSALKRATGVKDSGRLIPGHGGVIDRVDGLVAALMAAALIGSIRLGASAAGDGLLLWQP